MIVQHKDLTDGRWQQLSFIEQMANIGSEVERAINWRSKNNANYSEQALERALELIDLTLKGSKSFPRLREIARVRETLVDYFWGTNDYKSSDALLKEYFLCFTYAARRNK